jgi:hypothetical protein
MPGFIGGSVSSVGGGGFTNYIPKVNKKKPGNFTNDLPEASPEELAALGENRFTNEIPRVDSANGIVGGTFSGDGQRTIPPIQNNPGQFTNELPKLTNAPPTFTNELPKLNTPSTFTNELPRVDTPMQQRGVGAYDRFKVNRDGGMGKRYGGRWGGKVI